MINHLRRNKRQLLVFTILFAVLSGFIFSFFYCAGNSFLWKADGLYQHYNSLAYYGEYLRGIIKTLFSEGRFEIPMWDFSIGYGSDIITTLHYYVIGDPINLLSIFFSKEKTELLYHILIFIRLYLVGISFLVFCKRMKKDEIPSLIGGIIYVFCGYALVAAVRHPYFVTPMIYLPLILVGIEKILNKEKPYLFIGMVFVSAISNFYFFYMLTILMFLYTAVRFLFWGFEDWKRQLFVLLGKFTGFYLVGLLMACSIFYPVILQMLSTNRANIDININLLYDFKYYVKLLSGYTSTIHVGDWTYLGYAAIVVPCIACLVALVKKKKEVLTLWIVLSLFLCIPFVGYAFNGMSYVSNRWVFGYSLMIAYIVADTLPDLLAISGKKLAVTMSLSTLYMLGYGVLLLRKHTKDIWPFLFCMVYCLIIGIFYFLRKKGIPNLINIQRLLLLGTLAVVTVNVMTNISDLYSKTGRNYVDEFYESGKALDFIEKGEADLELGDEEFVRYESNPYNQRRIYNSTLQTGRFGTTYFFSLANEYIYSYMEELEVNIDREFLYVGLDGRSTLGSLAAVKYFEVKKGNEKYLPYGYTKQVYSYEQETGSTINGYRNKYALPLGFTYDNAVSYEEYQALSSIRKQQALLQSAVLADNSVGVGLGDLTFTDEEIPYSIARSEGVTIEDHKLIVDRDNAKVVLKIQENRDRELYIRFQNLSYVEENPLDKVTEEKWEGMSWKRKMIEKIKYANWTGRDHTVFDISAGRITKTLKLATEDYAWYSGRHDFLVDLGYNEKNRKSVEITFSDKGVYSFDEIQVIAVDLESYAEQIEQLTENTMESVVLGTNSISGTVETDREKILCLSVPYSDGWKIYVNGEEKELLRINTMYMGVTLPAGVHEIELKYRTPGLKAGVGLTLAGILALGVIVMDGKRKRKHTE